jgi:hypothetical protein
MKCHENPSRESRFIPYRRTDRWTDMMKPIVVSGNFANAQKNLWWSSGIAAFVLDSGTIEK